ncbi:epoxide hydrolase, soluble (sEH) [Scheffersomyces spartinae]|uniref:Epoxide hydrolase, soluble (SEH) n=1 Tax=Scheffersomyces spartinae TaxID=45513 RepID=A0A9P7VDA0_9ASCO|nr:epoxide hydrolase, soluble (sEH) [Scheffersomyces spartinae]KAG7195710.1 epoxide hydrolase, soluble (sEH) [Scheffersomyces spartinae]
MQPFITGHEELIHDVEYDFYGTHIATCSSDQHIKVFDYDATTSQWILNDLWKAHNSLVVRLSWANPEFSSAPILASCSYDRTVKIWQEQPDELHGSGRRWIKLATLAIESYGPIYDVVFAPSHLGLKLACVGSDSIFRIYDSIDSSDLTQWALTTEIPLSNLQLPVKSLQSSFSIEWCPSKYTKTLKFIVVVIDQAFIYSTLPNSDNDELDSTANPGRQSGLQSSSNQDHHHHHQESTGDDEAASKPPDSDTKYLRIASLPEHNGLIRSVSWAPSMGRLFHLIATGCKDGFVRIFKVKELPNGELEIETVAALSDHKLEVWRVKWNNTGTILSSAGDDGNVRLWKSNYLNEWKCMSVINTSNRTDNRIADNEQKNVPA